jgi:NADH-quinone oxidoreductase subunit K
MAAVPLTHALVVAGVLFGLGLLGVLVRRNLIFILMSIEVMLNAAGLAFVAAGSRWEQADGQVMFLFILATAAAEVAVGSIGGSGRSTRTRPRRCEADACSSGSGSFPRSPSPGF